MQPISNDNSGSDADHSAKRTASDETLNLESSRTVTFDKTNPSTRKNSLQRVRSYARVWWKFKPRNDDDDENIDWWFAATAIPLLAATLAPLANVLSIAALVTYWRMDTVVDGVKVPQLEGKQYRDPRWCYWLNVASLVLGFLGNLFLLFNFTRRIRYLIALPLTIIMWYIATGILVAITVCMQLYVPPDRAIGQTYTQGYWYAVIAAVLYCICSMLLMVNMLGYFLGHYPQHFNLTEHQRTLILQTMLFFLWLAGGGAVFSKVQNSTGGPDGVHWGFIDGLYFCDVTILTIGFGDLVPDNDVGRGLVLPYSVGGIIMLGLVISSIQNFTTEMGADKIVKGHLNRSRVRTIERTLTDNSIAGHTPLREIKQKNGLRYFTFHEDTPALPTRNTEKSCAELDGGKPYQNNSNDNADFDAPTPIRRRMTMKERVVGRPKKPMLLLLREEKDRFVAMRKIQHSTEAFKRWWRLSLSIMAFGVLWCVGAIVFWQCEKNAQGLTYFKALYLGYVTLLTIGYGDFAPKSNAGRAFFVVWSLVAVPTMTILVSDMGSTVIRAFKQGTFVAADFTVLPKEGVWRALADKNKWLRKALLKHEEKKRIQHGLIAPEAGEPDVDIEELAREAEEDQKAAPPSKAELARELGVAIKKAAHDLSLDPPKQYSYEEWVQITRLIRFTSGTGRRTQEEQEDQGLIQWDWIGEDSPMMSGITEAEFVLDRLVESLDRYMRKVERLEKRVDVVGPPEDTNLDDAELGAKEKGSVPSQGFDEDIAVGDFVDLVQSGTAGRDRVHDDDVSDEKTPKS